MRKMTSLGAALLIVATGGAALALDEPDETLIVGKVVVLKTGQRAKFLAKPVGSIPFDLPNVPENDPTTEGASLLLYDRNNNANQVTLPLPAPGWTVIGKNPAKGFRYKGEGTAADPCKRVSVKARRISVDCRGSAITLNPPFVGDGTLGATLMIGTNSKRYCPVFSSFKGTNEPGLFKGRNTTNGGAPCFP